MSNTEPWQDENKKLIVQSNDLITARYDLDIDGFRALTLFLSKVNQRLENPGWVSFTAHEFERSTLRVSGAATLLRGCS
ncbi:MAG TPA: RepB family plasmid replication initiator protein [Arsenophonus nasoniae]|uniref:RepB family plasmid replication initiator protein n=1 Tax=Arsenophonus nasoniae TaxID=638 RepID=UPI0038795A8E